MTLTYEETQAEYRAGRYTDHETMSNKVHEWIKAQYYQSKQTNPYLIYDEINAKIKTLFCDIYKELGLFPADGYPAWNEARDQMQYIQNMQYQKDVFGETANA